ncbi:MAG TPA: chromosome segregation protein SMC [Thermodesulfobacteriota bacterium]
MRIKRIDVVGFKSFCEKTSLAFPPGISAIVGPNGCGKSNVVDAIRWAMGEQSAQRLRGRGMEDVIFNGSETRKPLGMAEVSVTFTAEGVVLPPGIPQSSVPGQEGRAEIQVTRRLFRDGTSEYLLNDTPCRLKDINELFMGTGVGSKAYAIIEQGKIGQILAAKPIERRVLVEEAAGITRFKARRIEAEHKMEATRANLTRVTDILAEVKRQLNSLARQAKKAERYRGYRDQAIALERKVLAFDAARLEAEWTAGQSALDRLRDEAAAAEAAVSRADAAAEAMRVEALQLEERLRAAEAEGYRQAEALQQAESARQLVQRDLEQVARDQARREADRAGLAAEADELEREAAALTGQRAALEERAAEARAEADRREARVREVQAALRERQQELDRERTAEVEQAARLARAHNALAEGARRTGELDQRASRLAEATARLAADRASAAAAGESLRQDLEARRAQRAETETRLAAQRAEEARLREAVVVIDGELKALRESHATQSSRLASLRELEARYEWYQSGVRSLMLAADSAFSRREAVLGLVADLVETDARYETAVEAVLGERLQAVVVESHREGLEAIEYLKTQASGRSSFIPLAIKSDLHVRNGHEVAREAPPPEVIAPLRDLVRFRQDLGPVADYLLGDVWLVANLHEALALWARNGFARTLVTLDGEVVDPWGAVTGGAGAHGASAGILSKKREIATLAASLDALSAEIDARKAQAQSLEREAAAAAAEATRLREELHRLDLALVDVEKDLKASGQEAARLDREAEGLAYEASRLEADRRELESAIARAREEAAAAEADRAAREERIRGLLDGVSALEAQAAREGQALTEVKVAAAAEAERLAQVVREETRLAERRGEVERRLETLAAELAAGREEEARLTRELAALGERLDGLHAARVAAEAALVTAREAAQAATDRLSQADADVREARRLLDAARGRVSEAQVAQAERTMRREALAAQADERFRVTLEVLVAEGQALVASATEPLPAGEADASAPLLPFDVEAARAELAKLRDQMAALGEVSLGALEEYAELEERHKFLTEQQADLSRSLEHLQQAISRINRETRARFAETFEAINAQFKALFPRLFQGGRAELALTDEGDLLETGIEIVAQPPGKKLQNVLLLSGGEKALSAVALIFAIFLVRPSPFCLLDEVDAPLDEANIGRFNDMVKEMATKSQFLLITHNKRTMEIADTLYGITMEEPGVSKVVSVRLTEEGVEPAKSSQAA